MLCSPYHSSPVTTSPTCPAVYHPLQEGYPHARYYGGNEFIDQAEELCRCWHMGMTHGEAASSSL